MKLLSLTVNKPRPLTPDFEKCTSRPSYLWKGRITVKEKGVKILPPEGQRHKGYGPQIWIKEFSDTNCVPLLNQVESTSQPPS